MRVCLFGKVRLETSDGEVHLGPPAQRKLLALLACEAGRLVSLDRLIEEMWGGSPPANAAATIRNYVSRLRRIFETVLPHGAQALITETSGYRLQIESDSIDVLRFERLVAEGEAIGDPARIEEALALWTDEPLADLPYDDTAIALRERFQRRRVDALEIAFEARLRSGAAIQVVEEAAELVEADPMRERLWLTLAKGLTRLGRQTEALRVINRYRAILVEVGLVPGPEILQLEDAILQGEAPSAPWPDRGHLPAPVDDFIGRETELEAVAQALTSWRLVTLVGAAGSGKTRLAIEATRRSGKRAWFVDLGTISKPERVSDAVLAAFQFPQGSASDPIRAVVDRIGADPVVVILDNCEHLLDAAATTAETLLRNCPTLTVLATSREPLRMRGEHVMEVPPMSTPLSDGADEVLASDAGRLFVDRARSVSPGFGIDTENAPIVASILRQLDGLPLAIELAAVQLHSRPLIDVASSLEQILSDHGAGIRTLLPRHRTLAAALDWSYLMLDSEQQRIFRRLGVLTAAFDSEAFSAMGGAPPQLADLVAKSLVSRIGESQYRVLVPVREYARSLLDEAERAEAEQLRDAHYIRLAYDLGKWPPYDMDTRWQELFLANREHLLQALTNLLAVDPGQAASLIVSLLPGWLRIGAYSEGTRLATAALDVTTDPEVRSSLLYQLAFFLLHRGAFDEAARVIEKAGELIGAGESNLMSARFLNAYGTLLAEQGRLGEAKEVLTEAVHQFKRFLPGEWFAPMVNLAATYCWSGDLTKAESVIAELSEATASGTAPTMVRAYLACLEGISARVAGSFHQSERALKEATDRFAADLTAFHWSLAAVERASARYALGDFSGAERLVASAFAGGDRTSEGSVFMWLRGQRLRARLALRSGDPHRALSLLRSAARVAVDTGTEGGLAEIADTTALLAEMFGRVDVANRLVALADMRRAGLSVARDPYEEFEIQELRERLGAPVVDDPASTEELLTFLGLESSTVQHGSAGSGWSSRPAAESA